MRIARLIIARIFRWVVNNQYFKFLFAILVLLFVCDLSGVHRHMFEKDFKEFKYPIEAEDFVEIVNKFRNNEIARLQPINRLYSEIEFLSKADKGCPGPYEFLIMVKSAPGNFDNRDAIRTTWKLYTKVPVKIVFVIGNSPTNLNSISTRLKNAYNGVLLETTIQEAIDKEIVKYNDIVHLDFMDSYYNNTIKTMMEIRWAVEICNDFRYALLVDDDYYVSIKTLARFVRNPKEYPKKPDENDTYDENTRLYAGFKLFVAPHRHKIGTKWFMPVSEYPFDHYPPYITAGAILLSKQALIDIYYASFFVKHFQFDDIFIAICAKKMNIEPINSNYFRFWSVGDDTPDEHVVASHGFRDPDRLFRFWNAQRSLDFT